MTLERARERAASGQLAALALALLLPSLARAASPSVEQVLPRGGQRGTELRLTLRGQRLADAEGLLVDGPGLEALGLVVQDARTVHVRLRIAPDCPPGERALRLRTRSGLSELRTFFVGTLPVIAEAEPNPPTRPQAVALDVTLEGALAPDEADAFAFTGRAGQRVCAEVEAMRLGGPVVDPVLTLLDPDGRPLAACDDAPLLGQDATVAALLPRDGTYVVVLREAACQGGDRHRYRLHLGTFPRPLAAFPPGLRAGEETWLELLGDAGGVTSACVLLPASDDLRRLFVPGAPSPLLLRAGDLPGATEVEPNDARPRATEVTLPVALHGRFDRPGDVDWFRFTGAKGQRLRLRAFARALGSPADTVVDLYVAGGRQVASNDDAQGRLDADLAAPLPADGRYEVRVREFMERGGPAHVYRVEVAPVASALRLDLQTYGRNTQQRNALVVPRGNRMAVLVRVEREVATGPVALELSGLPPDVGVLHTAVCTGDAVPLLLEAAPVTSTGAWLAELTGAFVEQPRVRGGLRQRIPLTVGAPNNAVYWTRTVDRLAVAVTEPAPFRVSVVEPRVPLVPSGAAQLEVVVERDAGYEKPVFVSLLQDPPGVGSRRDVKVERDRAAIGLTANARAGLGRWPLVVVARGEAPGGGDVWVSSQLLELEVAPPLLRLALTRTAGPRGGAVELAGELAIDRPFAGEATARLVGLPAHCAAPALTVTAETRALRFPVTIGAEARVARHRGIFCELVVPQEGGTVTHQVGHTELRVDPPSDAPPPVAGPGLPRSRLEQLRAEHAARRQERGE